MTSEAVRGRRHRPRLGGLAKSQFIEWEEDSEEDRGDTAVAAAASSSACSSPLFNSRDPIQ